MSGKRARGNPIAEQIEGGLKTADVLGVPVADVSVAQFSEWLLARLRSGEGIAEPAFITYLNAACSNIAADDLQYQQILNEADCVYADGQAIVWAGKWLGKPLPERVNAGDFIVEFCRELARRGINLALVGGRPEVAAQAAARWKQSVPELQVVCTCDGFFDGDGAAAVQGVRESGADLLLIGMGVPLQEKWAWAHRGKFGVRAVWCVGALFEYYGENRARAPWWMRRAGLEWLFRLVLEPRRLWRRYLVGNVRFVWRVLRAR
jgi:N-acetylglucosaminyldiphosphoundecaprenol N-acetyl-beta-D-mannosaminyltransferase